MRRFNGTLPWTKSCFVCGEDNPHGLHLKSWVEGKVVRLKYTTRASDVGYRNLVHGGILATLLDEVMTWAAIISAGRMCVAAEMTTRLKKPVEVAMDLDVAAWTEKLNRRLILVQSEARDSENKVLVGAQGKYTPMPQAKLSLASKDFVYDQNCIQPSELFPD